jgi:hypothetical protein
MCAQEHRKAVAHLISDPQHAWHDVVMNTEHPLHPTDLCYSTDPGGIDPGAAIAAKRRAYAALVTQHLARLRAEQPPARISTERERIEARVRRWAGGLDSTPNAAGPG